MNKKNKSNIVSVKNETCKNVRIGKFAKSNGISIDTIRYYIQLNLIHPFRKGKYFYFGNEQQKQLDKIIHYKELRFSLDEIKILMNTGKLSILETPVKSNYIEKTLKKQMDKLQQEKIKLEDIINNIKYEIDSLNRSHNQNVEGKGITFNQLEMLYCPVCQKSLSITDGMLKNNSVYSGNLVCDCGVTMKIEDGILLTSENVERKIHPIDNKDPIISLLKSTSSTFIEQMLYYVEEITRYTKHHDLGLKTVLSMKTGVGTLALSLLKTSEIGLLILFDEDLEQLKVAKKTINKCFPDKKVLYIGGCFNMIPIKRESVDLAIDFAASFEASLQTSENLYQYLISFMKSNSMIIGLYLYFKKTSILAELESRQSELLKEGFVRDYLKQNGYLSVESFNEQKLEIVKEIEPFYKYGDAILAHLEIYSKNECL